MSTCAEAHLMYGVALCKGEHNEVEFDDNFEEVVKSDSLIFALQQKYPHLNLTAHNLDRKFKRFPEELGWEMTGCDETRHYLVLKAAVYEITPGYLELVIDPEKLREQEDEEPFKRFFEMVDLPYVKPQWHLGTYYG